MSTPELPPPEQDAPEPPPSEGDEPDSPPADEVDAYRMTLLEHLVELRTRLIRAAIGVAAGLAIALPLAPHLLDFLKAPAEGRLLEGDEFISGQLYEGFMTDVKVGLFGALLLAMPIIAWQAWGFVAPGLYKKERRMVIPFVLLSTLLFVGGVAICYYGILPYAIDFFATYNDKRDLESYLTVAGYLKFVIRFLVAFGAVFQTPLVIFFLARMGLVTAAGLKKFRRYSIVFGFVLAAVITPPDPGSQIAVALPFILLYEVGIVTAKIWGRPPIGRIVEEDAEEEPEAAEDEPAE